MNARGLFAAFLLGGGILAAGTAGAAAQSIQVVKPSCLPRKGNGVVRAVVIADANAKIAQAPRLYFREKGEQSFYWVAMEAEPGGKFWAVLPRPETRNPEVEYYAALADLAGKPLSRSETGSVRISDNCASQLTPQEKGFADNLIVGETSASQQGKKVFGFLCPGIKIRVDHQGIRRADEECGPCGLSWLAPAAATAGVLGVLSTEDSEPSPSRP